MANELKPCPFCGGTPLLSAGREEKRMSESNYEKLFGTPERAAQTLSNLSSNCNNGFCFAPKPEDATYDAMLELLRGDAE